MAQSENWARNIKQISYGKNFVAPKMSKRVPGLYFILSCVKINADEVVKANSIKASTRSMIEDKNGN